MPTKVKPLAVEVNGFQQLNMNDHPRGIGNEDLSILMNAKIEGRSIVTFPGSYDIQDSNADLGALIISRSYLIYIAGVATYIIAGNLGGDGYLYKATYNHSDLKFTFTQLNVIAPSFINPRFATWFDPTTAAPLLLIIDPVAGYYTWDGTTLSARINSPLLGSCIEVFKDQVFIATGRSLTVTAPGTYNDFTIANGAVILVDRFPSIQSGIVALKATADYLYVVGDYGTHLVYGYQYLSSEAGGLFQVSDAIPGVGTTWGDAVCSEMGSVFIMSSSGGWMLTGTSVTRLTDPIRTLLFQAIPSFLFFANVNGERFLCFGALVLSPPHGAYRMWLMCFYQGSWWICDAQTTDGLYDHRYQGVAVRKNGSDDWVFAFGTFPGPLVAGAQIFQDGNLKKWIRTKSFISGSAMTDKTITKVGCSCSANISPTLSIITDFSDSVTGVNETTSDSDDYLLSGTVNARGKAFAMDFQETSGNNYALTGFMTEGESGVLF